jgi:hypothetical protein
VAEFPEIVDPLTLRVPELCMPPARWDVELPETVTCDRVRVPALLIPPPLPSDPPPLIVTLETDTVAPELIRSTRNLEASPGSLPIVAPLPSIVRE